MKISTVDFNKVLKQPDLLAELRKLTLHCYSGLNKEMNSLIEINKTRRVNVKAIIAEVCDQKVGWALFSRESSDYHFGPKFNGIEDGYNAGHGVLFECFVHPLHRKRGVGKALLKKAAKLANGTRLCVAPWDYVSRKFYEGNPDINLLSLTSNEL